jgi:ADP-ribosylglycohydrolase
MDRTVKDRLLACLKGIATGDAIGKQTEALSRDEVLRWYPEGVYGFEGPPGSVIPRYAGNPRREWRIGETTDDTERTIAVARAILQDGDVRHTSVGRELLSCTKSVHPGVQSLWEFHQAGDATRVTDKHNGCGGAIRVAPVGILYSSDRLNEIVAGARLRAQLMEVRWRSRPQRLPRPLCRRRLMERGRTKSLSWRSTRRLRRNARDRDRRMPRSPRR